MGQKKVSMLVRCPQIICEKLFLGKENMSLLERCLNFIEGP